MKKLTWIICAVVCQIHFIRAEQLIDLYKRGEIEIQPDTTFKSSNNINDIFNLKQISNIAVDRFENIYLLDRKAYIVLVFNKTGNLVNRINLNIRKSTSVYHHVNELNILDNQYLLIRQYSRILVLDLNGQMIKSIEFDYPIYDMVALRDNKVGIKGWIQLSNRRTKTHIAIFDIRTEREHPVVHFIKNDEEKKESVSFEIENKGGLSFSNRKHAPNIFMERTLDGNLIVGNSAEPVISVYALDGEQVGKINLNYNQLQIDQAEKDEYLVSLRNQLIKLGAPDSLLEKIQSPDFYYQVMPYYYAIKVDSEGNILVFKYSSEKDHIFRVYQVYSSNGRFICECKLDPGDFEAPNLRLMTFHNHHLYGLFNLKSENDIKLVKAQLK